MAETDDPDRRLRVLREFVARSSNIGPRALLDESAATALVAFEANDVGALLLKGPALAQHLYRAGEHRSYVDIDVLVDPRRLDRARAVLADLGYNDDGTRRAGVDDFLGILDAELWAGPRGCGLDLHWRLTGCGVAPERAWALLYATRATAEVAGRRLAVLGDDGLALHVATHAAQSGPRDPKAMGDLARALERWPAERWRGAARLADELDATDALAAGLRLHPAGVTLAEKLGLPRAAAALWAINERPVRPRGTFHLRSLMEAASWPARMEIVRRSMLPTSAWLAAEIPWARRGRAALLAARLLHVVRAPLWAARALGYDRRARRAQARDR